MRDSEHYFFEVGKFASFLREWLDKDGRAHPSVKAKLREWLDSEGGVRDWDISRDAPYFGFEIPGTQGTKFFYVWLDAPIGYLASFKKYCASEKGRKNGLSPGYFHRFMRTDDPEFIAEAEMHHFLGKDIVNFHGLFWPAMLKGAAFREPTALHVNGYLTVNGAKMSKSRGTFIQARTYLDAGLNPEFLRYYFATMLTAAPVDIDLDLKAFEERVNSHLVGKFVNIASRCAGFIEKFFDGQLAAKLSEESRGFYDFALSRLHTVTIEQRAYESGDFSTATRVLVEVADYANGIIAEKAPWLLAKEIRASDLPSDSHAHRSLHDIATLAINWFRLLACYAKPVLPITGNYAETFLSSKLETFAVVNEPLLAHRITPYEIFLTRVNPDNIITMIESSKESLAPTPSPPNPPLEGEGLKARTVSSAQPSALSPATISIDDFAKLDLRIGTVLHCSFVENSDKLLRFELDAGELGKRQIFSGIRASYGEPEKLVGRKVVFIANLAPRKMRFGVSEGMILSAGDHGGLFLLDVDNGAAAGMPVK